MKAAARCISIVTLGALLAACGEQPTSPPGTPARPPALSIHDGAHGGGNPGFFFLPPLVKNPTGNVEFGDAAFTVVAPVVRICRLAGNPDLGPTSCAEEIVSFSGSQIAVSTADRQYSVNWDTKTTTLSTSTFYRMSVYVGTQMLGFADVDPVSPQELRNARTGETIPLVDGRTLPIKFTIEQDGLCAGDGECTIVTVSNTGGSFTLPSGHGGIYLPEGWLPPEITQVSMTLQRVATGSDNDCLEEGFTGPGLVRQYEGCMRITTDPDLTGTAGIQQQAVVGLCVEIPSTHPDYHYIQMFKSDAGRDIVGLADASPAVIAGFNCAGFTGTADPSVIGSLPAPLQFFASAALRGTRALGRLVEVQSLHAIDLGEGGRMEIGMDFSHFGWGLQGTMSGVGPGTVSVPLNGVTTLSTRVLANHVHQGTQSPTVLQNVPVTFTITSTSGGQLGAAGGQSYTSGPLTVLTNQAGEAQVDFLAGATAATHTIVATANALDAPITFTVNGGSVLIDFETWPATTDGPCSPCSLSSQYGPNAQFSFMPDGGTAIAVFPAARVEGGPYHAVTNHSATVPSSQNGYSVGTLVMGLGGDPTQASFKLRYAADTVTPQVTVYRYDTIESVVVPVTGAATSTFVQFTGPTGNRVREETFTVSVPGGIYRIGISGGTNTSAIYLDDITIVGAVFPVIN